MSMSLRDQLLQAGLVNEKQAKEAERQQQQQLQGRQRLPKQQRSLPSEQELATRKAQQSKAARDAQLNRQHQDKAERRARLAQVRQLIEQHRLPKPDCEQFYNFVDGNKIRRIAADAAMRERLARGEIAQPPDHGQRALLIGLHREAEAVPAAQRRRGRRTARVHLLGRTHPPGPAPRTARPAQPPGSVSHRGTG